MQCKNVPDWMFLGWLNQLLAYVDTDKVSAVKDILLRIAVSYSNALVLPFHFVSESIADAVGPIRRTTKALIEKYVEITLF
jgi:hypothetical protein